MIIYRELSSLEHDLNIPAKTLYAVSNRVSSHYRPVFIPKKDGTARRLFVPDAILKTDSKKNFRGIAFADGDFAPRHGVP